MRLMWIEILKIGVPVVGAFISGFWLNALKNRWDRRNSLEVEERGRAERREVEDRQRAERLEAERRERIERREVERRQVLLDLYSAVSTVRSLPACPQGATGPEITAWFRERAEACGKIRELANFVDDHDLRPRIMKLWFLGEPLDLDMLALVELRDGIFEEDLRRDLATFALNSISSALGGYELPDYTVTADAVVAAAENFAICVVRRSRTPGADEFARLRNARVLDRNRTKV